MNDLYTPAVQWALQSAQCLAKERNAEHVEPWHLFHALLQSPDGHPYGLLVQSGIPMESLADFVIHIVRSQELPEVSLHEIIDTALQLAEQFVRETMSADPVGSDVILLMLLREDDELRREMQALGLDFPRLEECIHATLHNPPLELEEPLDLSDPVTTFDASRIIDANANRAREGLRVLEEYARFVLEDAYLSKELKSLRHELAELLQALGKDLLAARETQHDVGTRITTSSEQIRTSPAKVIEANAKRVQEALRCLEEYGKLQDGNIASRLERLRYRLYTVERMLLPGFARTRLTDVRLYVLLTGSLCWGSLEHTVREAAAGGAKMFQLREKTRNDRDLLERACQIRRWTRDTGTLLIINDRPDIARLAEADGVHLGQDDLFVKDARRLLGRNAIIGVSTHDIEQVHAALRDGADYIGVGPTFPSPTKAFTDYPGVAFVRQVAAETALPAFVLGGVTLANLPQVVAAGGRRVAVSQAVCGSETPQATAAALARMLPHG